VDDLVAGVVGVHAPEAQVRHHDLDLIAFITNGAEVRKILDHIGVD